MGLLEDMTGDNQPVRNIKMNFSKVMRKRERCRRNSYRKKKIHRLLPTAHNEDESSGDTPTV